MAETEVILGDGGVNDELRTVLWENSDVTATFTAQNITLSDDISNYDYLEASARLSTSDNRTVTIRFNTKEFSVNSKATTVGYVNPAVGYHQTSAAKGCREISYVDSTTIYITSCVYSNDSGSGGLSNTNLIPIKIVGINVGVERVDYNSLTIKTFYGTQSNFTVEISPNDKVFCVASNGGGSSNGNGLAYTELKEGDNIVLQYSLSGSTFKTRFERSGNIAKATHVTDNGGGFIAVLSHVDANS